jgi:hypothetical protein
MITKAAEAAGIKYISGVKPDGNRYAQWWAPAKIHGLTSVECVAEVWERGGRFGVTVIPEAPDNMYESVWYVLMHLHTGMLVPGSHTVTWKFGKPTFSEVAS